MLHNGLSAAERPGNRRHAALCNGEQRVYYPLARYHRLRGGKLFLIGPAAAHGPFLEHGQLYFALIGSDFRYRLKHVRFARIYPRYLAAYAVWHHYFMEHGVCFLHCAQHVARAHVVAHACDRNKVPKLFVVNGVHAYAAVYSVSRLLAYNVQGALYAVVYRFYKPRRKLNAQRRAGGFNRLSRAYAARFFIYLYARAVRAQLYNLADQLFFTNAHHVVHLHVRHAVGHYKGARYLYYGSFYCHLPLLIN